MSFLSRATDPSRLAAGALVAVAALGLTACEGKSDDASSPAHSKSATSGSSSKSAKSPGESGTSSTSSTSGTSGTHSKPKSAHSSGTSKESGASHASGAVTGSGGPDSRCTTKTLRASVGHGDVGAGNVYYSLVFTNTGSSSCVLRGYPGVSLIQRDGQTIGKPATHEAAAGGPVTIAPHHSAHATLHTANKGVSDKPCWKSAHLLKTYPPGSKSALNARPNGLRVCGGTFTVTSVKSGSTG